jgi:hypothetical protein
VASWFSVAPSPRLWCHQRGAIVPRTGQGATVRGTLRRWWHLRGTLDFAKVPRDFSKRTRGLPRCVAPVAPETPYVTTSTFYKKPRVKKRGVYIHRRFRCHGCHERLVDPSRASSRRHAEGDPDRRRAALMAAFVLVRVRRQRRVSADAKGASSAPALGGAIELAAKRIGFGARFSQAALR